jgi:TonB-dependent SusC/RagA subfamily outer membrane receptor
MKKTILFSVLALLCLFLRVNAQGTKPPNYPIDGIVTDEKGNPLPGASIKITNTGINCGSNTAGQFGLNTISFPVTLVITFVGYDMLTIQVTKENHNHLVARLHLSTGSLNEVQIIGYGTTTKRLNTGSVSSISSKEIEDQPVTNVLSAISGRAPGVYVQTTNGLPGGNISIQIRGKGSISAGTDPLYIIDGVPFESSIGGAYTAANGILGGSSVNGTVSPFNSINPDDIASISILKDADATAIYGSRGSNGVVLITTKQGRGGKSKIDFNFSQGINGAADLPRLLNLQQYLDIRKEAFANDGLVPSNDPNDPNYAPDLTAWSQNKGTDWGKYLLGGTGHVTDAQFSISGGAGANTFSAGGNFHSETSYLKGNDLYQRGGVHINFQHTSANSKFHFQYINSLILDNNKLSNPPDLGTDILLPPNYPLYDASGNYNWFYVNPAAETQAVSLAKYD